MKDESRDSMLFFSQLKSNLAKIGSHCTKKVGHKDIFWKSRDNMINESRGLVCEIPSP